MKNSIKLILFLSISSSFILLMIFTFESEKYHSFILNKELETNTERIEIQILYLGIIIENIYPDNFVSLYLYDTSFNNYNSTIALKNSFNILINTNQHEKVADRYDNHKKFLALIPITEAEVLNFLGRYQEAREVYEEIYDKLTFESEPNYKISIWQIRDSVIKKQYDENEFANKISKLIDKGENEESQYNFENSLNTFHKVILLDKSNIKGLEGVFKAVDILENSINISKNSLTLLNTYKNQEKIINYFPLEIQKNIYKSVKNYEGFLRSLNYFYEIKVINWDQRDLFVKEIYNNEKFNEKINSNLIQAQNYEKEGKYEEALKIYDKILNGDKYFLPALIGNSVMNQKFQNEDKVEFKIKRILEVVKLNNQLVILTDEKNEKMNDVKRRIHEIKNNDNQILSIYNEILTVDSFNKNILESYAELLMKKELYPSAIQAYSKLLILEPDNNEYLNKIRDLDYIRNPNLEEEINSLVKMTQNHEKEEKYEEAIIEYRKVLGLDSQIIEAQHGITYSNAQLGNELEVLVLLEQYDLEEQNKAEILFLIEHFEEALKIYDKLIEKEKMDGLWIKRQLTSEKLYEDSKFSEKINSNLIQAQNFEKEGKYEEALEIYEDILDNDKFLFQALKGALRSNIYLEKESETRKLLKISERLPDKIQQDFKNSYYLTMHEIAKNYQNSGKHGAAISIYRDLLSIDEFNVKALTEYGKLLEKMQMYEEAIKIYKKLFMLEPENLEYDEGLKRLEKIQEE